MVSEVVLLRARVQDQLIQLERECEVFDRLMYHNKNQHRRCLYYRALSKVRRDLRLFRSASLKDILKWYFRFIEGKNPTLENVRLEGLKISNTVANVHEFETKLLGAARLLAQMIEPIIEASLHLCGLLSLAFFIPFAISMLALLARLRVLLQQTLQDVVHVFNMSSSVSQGQQPLGALDVGPTVFRDHHTPNRSSLVLKCHWDGDKYCLHELAQSNGAIADAERTLLLDDDQGNDPHSLPTSSTIKHNFGASAEEMANATIVALTGATMKNKRNTNENVPTIQISKPDCAVRKNNDHGELLLPNEECSRDLLVGKDSSERSRLSDSTLPQSSKPAESKSGKKRKMDFISVDVPLKTEAKLNNSGKKLGPASNNGLSERLSTSANETTDHLFNLFVDRNKTQNLV